MRKTAICILLAFSMQASYAQSGNTDPNNNQNPVSTNQNPNSLNQTAWDYAKQTKIVVGEVPSTVNDAFKEKYPDQMKPIWYRGQNGYMVSYMDKDNIEQQVFYDRTGKMTSTGLMIKNNMLPESANTYLKEKYPGTTYDKIYKVTTNGKDSYMVYADGRWMTFDANGNIIPAK